MTDFGRMEAPLVSPALFVENSGVCSDTACLLAKASSDQSLRLHQKLIDLCAEAVIVRDGENYITFWSRGAERMYGWTAAQACGRVLPELVQSDCEQFDLASRCLEAEGEWSGELKEFARDGSSLVTHSRWVVSRDPSGRLDAILTINTDITSQKALEAQSLRAQRLESIGTLAGGVAHDLNNILTPIIMSAPMLREELPEDDREMIISTIETSAERGADMVKQVLTFARGVEGERVLLCVGHLIKEMVKISRETFPRTIEISSRVPRDLWPVVGDATQLHQVLLNLCVNARDAMPEGGRIVMSAGNLELDENFVSMSPGAKPGLYVMAEVADTGSGIPREMIDRIFDPFFTTKELGKGTGLGLSTVIGIVKSHGGFVHVDSEIGRGSTFRIYLPATPESKSGVTAPSAQDLPSGNGELVLVVDDEQSICRVTGSMLEKYGYRVMVAGDGTEALARFAQAHGAVRVVLTDLMMPFMDGLTLIRTLQRMDPGVSIIASTGQGDEPRMAELQKMNIRHALRKPYNAEVLLTTLRACLEAKAQP